MKIEYCDITVRNPCHDQPWCCDRFRDFNRNGLVMIFNHKFCLYTHDKLMCRVMNPINFCPFCGEKIDD